MFSRGMQRIACLGTETSVQIVSYGMGRHAGIVIRGKLTATPETNKNKNARLSVSKNGASFVFSVRYGGFLTVSW